MKKIIVGMSVGAIVLAVGVTFIRQGTMKFFHFSDYFF